VSGCCLITGILGSASNSVDLPIPLRYKLDSSQSEFLVRFKSLASEIMNDFDSNFQALDEYRIWLKNEPKVFKQQIADYFC
jgi:hypothetical protein